jgi:leucyl aminopeptidase
MISGQAMRPGDVVTAMSGKTIEVLNTDAEGRLILADALTLAEKDGSDIIIDLATLTGACMVALGTGYAGIFANDDRLAADLLEAGDRAGEHLWRMPLAPEYKEWIKSPVADIKNLGRPYGGAITAALFLQEFVEKARWAHLDIAGTAFADGDYGHIRKGGVGFGVRTLLNFIKGDH